MQIPIILSSKAFNECTHREKLHDRLINELASKDQSISPSIIDELQPNAEGMNLQLCNAEVRSDQCWHSWFRSPQVHAIIQKIDTSSQCENDAINSVPCGWVCAKRRQSASFVLPNTLSGIKNACAGL